MKVVWLRFWFCNFFWTFVCLSVPSASAKSAFACTPSLTKHCFWDGELPKPYISCALLCCACCAFGNIYDALLLTLCCVSCASLLTCKTCAAVLQIFALFLVHAYSTRVWKRQAADSSNLSAAAVEHGFQSPEGHSKLIMDGPWILLWPCLLLWPFFEGVVGFGFIHNAVGDAILLATPLCFY